MRDTETAEQPGELSDERIDEVLARAADVRYILANPRARIRLFARAIEAEVRATLSAAPAGQLPEGMKLAPIEPTDLMVGEGSCAQSLPGPHYISTAAARQCWKYMLSASPATLAGAPAPIQPQPKVTEAMIEAGAMAALRYNGCHRKDAKPDDSDRGLAESVLRAALSGAAPTAQPEPLNFQPWPPGASMLQVAVAPHAAAGPYPTAMRPATAEEAAAIASRLGGAAPTEAVQQPVADVVASLQACADDPMWADHAEVAKTTLLKAVALLSTGIIGSSEPVAEVTSWTNGSYSRHYKLRWLRDVPEGTKLYATPPSSTGHGAAADHKDAWCAVVDALREVHPNWAQAGHSGIQSAVNTIKRLAREAAVPRYQMHPCGLWVGQRVRAKADLINDLTSDGMGISAYARKGDVLVVRDFSEHRIKMFVKVSHEDVTDNAFTAAFDELEPIDALAVAPAAPLEAPLNEPSEAMVDAAHALDPCTPREDIRAMLAAALREGRNAA